MSSGVFTARPRPGGPRRLSAALGVSQRLVRTAVIPASSFARPTSICIPSSHLQFAWVHCVAITMFLRQFMRPLLASANKGSTGIVGLDVVPNAREVLISLYQQTLQAVKPIPEDAQYRKSVEALTQHRLKVCQEEEEWQNIEKRIQCGQVEELIVQAKDELQLIPKMAEWKPWEVPEGYKVEVIEDDDSIPSHVPIHK